MAFTNAKMAGLLEGNVAPGSGLSYRQFRFYLTSAQTQLVNARPIGGAGSAPVLALTPLAMNNQFIPYGGTLCAHIVQATPVASNFRLRVEGFDQFHQQIVELTPVTALAAKTNNFVYLAKPFVHVVKVEFTSVGLDIATDTISLGTRWDWVRTTDGANEHLAGLNLGVALPLRSGRRIGTTSRTPFNFTQRTGPATILNTPPVPGNREPLEILGCTFHDMTAVGAPVVPVTEGNIRVGQSETGWEAPAEKLHFLAAGVAAWAPADEIVLGFQMLSADNMT